MIIYEDESEALENGRGVIVPFLVNEYKSEIVIEAYDGAREQISCILARCGGSFFKKSSIDIVDSLLEPYVNKLGYYREISGKYRWYHIYGASSADALNISAVKKNTVLLNKEHLDLKNLTSFDLKELLTLQYPSAIVLEQGMAVALASVNPCQEGKRVLEVTVETARPFRRLGFGISAVVKLSMHLIGLGYTVNYVCSRYNRPSVLLAEKCGFEKMGRIYAYTAYKDM